MPQSLIYAPEVLQELGGQAAADVTLADAVGPFRCTVCGNLGSASRENPASVVITVVRGTETQTRDIKLAHSSCSDSKVRVVRAVTSAGRYTALPGAAWLRPADTDPPAVLVIARHVPELALAEDPQTASSFLSRLLEHGFALLGDPDTPLPHVKGLTAWHTAGRLAIHDRYGEVVWDGRLPSSHAWTYAALRSQRLGVVVASGVRLTEPGQARGLYSAITSGRAAGAAIALTNPTASTSRRWPLQTRGYAVGAA